LSFPVLLEHSRNIAGGFLWPHLADVVGRKAAIARKHVMRGSANVYARRHVAQRADQKNE
jgi:hypothetical protein